MWGLPNHEQLMRLVISHSNLCTTTTLGESPLNGQKDRCAYDRRYMSMVAGRQRTFYLGCESTQLIE